MRIEIRAGDLEAAVDTDGEFLTPEAVKDYLVEAAEIVHALWSSLPGMPEPVEDE